MGRKIKLQFSGSTKSGSLTVMNRDKMASQVLRVFPASSLLITIEERKRKRSISQNAFYWAVIVPEIRAAMIDAGNEGTTHEEVHAYLKARFNPRMISNKHGEFIEIGSSTTQLTRSEFSDYIAQVKAWAADFFGVTFPEPDEQIKLNF